jgi:hypothetical protein
VAACEIAFGVKLCSSTRSGTVVAQRLHEAARRRRESALVEADEADDVAEQRVGHVVPRRRLDALRGTPLHVRRQLTAGHQQVQGEPRRHQALPCRRVNDGDRLRWSHVDWWRSEERKAKTVRQ